MTTKATIKNTELAGLRRAVHPNCFVCGELNPRGMQLDFHFDEESRCVCADFRPDKWSEGYKGMPHGGIISAVLDGAMGNCLFAQGITGITGELNIRFKHPVRIHQEVRARAWIKTISHPYYLVKSEIIQDGQVKAYATGKFIDKPDLAEGRR